MLRVALRAGTILRASGAFVAYAVGMSALGVSSLYLATEFAKTIAAESLSSPDRVAGRAPSRVEKRLLQLAKARRRMPREAHPDVLAYTVPKMHPAALAMAMDLAERPAKAGSAPAVVVADNSVEDAKPESSAGSSGELNAEGLTRVAGYLATGGEQSEKQEATASGSDERSEETSAEQPSAIAIAKTKSSTKRSSIKNDLRIADTPGMIIQRKLAGTT
jgi:hypothetical protein